MDINLLKSVLEVPTVYENEIKMSDFLIAWGIRNSITVIVDIFGNVYLIKGQLKEGEHYPCVIAHMDTVQKHTELIETNTKLKIIETKNSSDAKFHPDKTILTALNPLKTGAEVVTGVGGDDKAGIAICLDIITKSDKIIGAFFKTEEIGCFGAKNADRAIMNQVGYAMEFDAPGSDWLSYVSNTTQLFERSFFKLIDPILLRYGISNIRDCDPFTDIFVIKRTFDFNCLNFFAGYYKWHTEMEYVVYEDTIKAADMGKEIIDLLGNKKYEFVYNKQIESMDKVIF